MSNTFGLDIGSKTMKAVALEKVNDVWKFKSAILAQTPQKGMASESPLDQEEMVQVMQQMLVDGKIHARNVHLALPDNYTYAKVIEMPLLTEKELANAIYWEAEQHIPVPLNTINIDWRVLRSDPEGIKSPKMQVLLIGATKTILDRYQKVFELAGISIASIETEILSVIRALHIDESFPNSLIVNIGGLATSLAIIQNGTIIFLYSIPLGGLAINRSIATEFGFSATQAEEYKKTYGLDKENFGGKIKAVIEPILSSLLSEIKKALSYYDEKHKNDHPISQIILSGGTAKLPGIIPIFVQETGIETVIANPWKALNVQAVPQELLELGPEYTIGIGLAAKDL